MRLYGCVLSSIPCYLRLVFVFAGFSQLVEKVGEQCARKVRNCSSRNQLYRRMLDLHPVFPSFVSGSKSGELMNFFCRVCHRDVRMQAHGAGQFRRHFRSNRHWFRDVAYRLHMGLTIYNRLLEPMELSASQEAEFRSRPLVDLAEGYPIPEDLLPKHHVLTQKFLL